MLGMRQRVRKISEVLECNVFMLESLYFAKCKAK